MELKTRQGKCGVRKVDCVQIQKKKILSLKVENKLVMRYRALNLTNQLYP